MNDKDILELIATELGKISDILMMQLSVSDPGQAAFVDWVHNKKNRFFSELSQQELDMLHTAWQQKEEEDEE